MLLDFVILILENCLHRLFKNMAILYIWFLFLDRTQRQEREVMLKLKEVVDKQRDELRAKVQEISSMSKEVEAVWV